MMKTMTKKEYEEALKDEIFKIKYFRYRKKENNFTKLPKYQQREIKRAIVITDVVQMYSFDKVGLGFNSITFKELKNKLREIIKNYGNI